MSAFNQEKALVGAFSVIVKLQIHSSQHNLFFVRNECSDHQYTSVPVTVVEVVGGACMARISI